MARKHKRRVRVCTYNLGDGPGVHKLEDLEGFASDGVRLMGLEEHGDRSHVTDDFVNFNPGWAKWEGDGRPGGKKTCILYRTDLGPVTAKASKTLVGRMLLRKGAGPEHASPKVANRIRLRVHGKRLHFIVGHEYATVSNRRRAAIMFMVAFVAWIRFRRGCVIAVGDMNMTPRNAMMRYLYRIFSVRSDVGGTHGRRQIDRILVKRGQIIEAWTKRGSSDHKAVIADVEF